MAIRPGMHQASFRGVTFHVRSGGAQIGRRTVVHQYPSRDTPYVEDMGRKAREFTIEAFVLGPDYMAARDKLEAACEQPGPGELIHPWRGRLNVAVMDCRPQESIEQLGMASFSITFTESGVNAQPAVRADTVGLVDAAADSSVAAFSADFAKQFSVSGQPDFVFSDATSQVNTALDGLLTASRGMLPDMSLLPIFNSQAGSVLGRVTQLLRLPTDLAASITGQIAGLRGLALAPTSAFSALQTLFGYGKDEPLIPRTTPARTAQADNREAVQALVRRTAIANAAQASARTEFASRNEALATRDALAAAIEAEAETAPDTVYLALTDLRVAVVRDITARGADLASLVNYTPKATLPALVIAHQLYGDAARSDEIVARNRVRHPGFVPGGQVLEVLA